MTIDAMSGDREYCQIIPFFAVLFKCDDDRREGCMVVGRRPGHAAVFSASIHKISLCQHDTVNLPQPGNLLWQAASAVAAGGLAGRANDRTQPAILQKLAGQVQQGLTDCA
jgi:hypothetical protein